MEIVASTLPEEPQPHSPIQPNQRTKTDIAWKYITEAQDETGKKSLVCTFCHKVFRGGGINRMKQHLAGVKGNVASCMKVPEDVKIVIQGVLEEKSHKVKERVSGLGVSNLDGDEGVEVQTSLAIEGKKKRVVDDDGDDNEALPPRIRVLKFDYSVENYFKVLDKIAMLSGESELEYEQTEIQRLSSSVTFLSKWRDFCYKPRAIRFACEKETSLEKDITTQINLPQFSSAAVPKDILPKNGTSSPLSKDFVMHVGGPVWALDWCPRVHQSSAFDTNVEFIAVSAHPPESSYHKIGAPLTGRGLIQIWCILNTGQSQQIEIPLVKVKRKSSTNIDPTQPKKPRGRPRKTPKIEIHQDLTKKVNAPQKPRGRPRKIPIIPPSNNFNLNSNSPKTSPDSLDPLALALQLVSTEVDQKVNSHKPHKPQKPKGRPRKKHMKDDPSTNFDLNTVNFHRDSVTETTNDSPKTSPEPLAVAFPDEPTKLDAIDRFPLYTREEISKVYTKVNTKVKVNAKVKANKKSEKGVDPPILSQNCEIESPVDQDDESKSKSKVTTSQKGVDPNLLQICEIESQLDEDEDLPRLVLGLANNKDDSLKSKSKSKGIKSQTRRKSEVKGDGPLILSQKCEIEKSPLDENEILPRLVMGVAHNGKVAWDVKWRPFDSRYVSKHVMGYLAVLLGNGALEVWEVPLPHVTKTIFSSCQKEGNDPRFLKLKPVFLCSMLKCGDRQSIPLTVEWSASAPHDLILAGCHDGVVALWKFSASSSSKDTRPLLCFSADTVPIRALKWAPLASDPESANTIVTAGHKGLKFWDIRDPFHPLWDIPSQKVINSLDWLPDPRCVVLSFDDGEIKIISLLKAASDVPVTGMPTQSDKKSQHGSYSYYCSSSSIWSVQVSRLTGMVAYSCSDGKVVNFQLTTKAVEKDPLRNRVPHYLCGSLTEEDSSLTVLSPLPYVPIPMKKSSTEWGDTPVTSRGVKSRSNQEKRAKDQFSKCQTPPKIASEGAPVITQKSNNDTSHDPQTSGALVCIDDDNNIEDKNLKKEETEEVFPPKIVAMHRATWNMNKGSERLVCYGGAAGIVRCQEIKKFATSK